MQGRDAGVAATDADGEFTGDGNDPKVSVPKPSPKQLRHQSDGAIEALTVLAISEGAFMIYESPNNSSPRRGVD